MSETIEDKLACSFCDKDRTSVAKLVAGPNDIYICNECVKLCYDIVSEEDTNDILLSEME